MQERAGTKICSVLYVHIPCCHAYDATAARKDDEFCTTQRILLIASGAYLFAPSNDQLSAKLYSSYLPIEARTMKRELPPELDIHGFLR